MVKKDSKGKKADQWLPFQAANAAKEMLAKIKEQDLQFYKGMSDVWSAFMDKGDDAFKKPRHRTAAKPLAELAEKLKSHYLEGDAWYDAEVSVHRVLTSALLAAQSKYLSTRK